MLKLIALTGCLATFWASPCLAQAESVTGLLDLRDGDSGYAGGIAIRLWGIDAPERGTPEGEAAWRCAQAMNGIPVRCIRKQRRLTYKRLVVQCFDTGGTDIAAAIVKAGHARDWPKFSGGAYARFQTPYPSSPQSCKLE